MNPPSRGSFGPMLTYLHTYVVVQQCLHHIVSYKNCCLTFTISILFYFSKFMVFHIATLPYQYNLKDT